MPLGVAVVVAVVRGLFVCVGREWSLWCAGCVGCVCDVVWSGARCCTLCLLLTPRTRLGMLADYLKPVTAVELELELWNPNSTIV